MRNIVGLKIRKLREDHGISQSELAGSIGVSREFISLLELGRREPSLETLSEIARFFQKSMMYFIGSKEDEFDLLLQAEKHLAPFTREIKRFKKLCSRYLQLETKMDACLQLAPLYANITAPVMAAEERRRLGLGTQLASDIMTLMEHNGLHILKRALPSGVNITGIMIFWKRYQAAFALINSRFSREQQVFTAAHLYSHYLKDRSDGPVIDNTDIFIPEYSSLYPVKEKFAQTFAIHFLLPEEALRRIMEHVLFAKHPDYAAVLYFKRCFGVPIEIVLHRLFLMGILSRSEVKEYKKENNEDGGRTVFHEKKKTPAREKASPEFSDRYKTLAFQALKKGRISSEEFARYLGIRKDQAEKI